MQNGFPFERSPSVCAPDRGRSGGEPLIRLSGGSDPINASYNPIHDPRFLQLRQLPQSPSRQTVTVNQCHPLRKKKSCMWASEWEVEHVRVMGDRWAILLEERET
ncbi:hypothetical protein CEXT_504461 [Caerostris extrusa]|uniref:Uncharacterized protein n=1 Tax=Caerostris extrusa TaxID=172846 RepID=A0AAV4XMS3_CAEEX|nr:hypothetical protein CEXT_504461 [Caerostris extrusa]